MWSLGANETKNKNENIIKNETLHLKQEGDITDNNPDNPDNPITRHDVGQRERETTREHELIIIDLNSRISDFQQKLNNLNQENVNLASNISNLEEQLMLKTMEIEIFENNLKNREEEKKLFQVEIKILQNSYNILQEEYMKKTNNPDNPDNPSNPDNPDNPDNSDNEVELEDQLSIAISPPGNNSNNPNSPNSTNDPT